MRILIFTVLLILSAAYFLSFFAGISTIKHDVPALYAFGQEHPFIALLLCPVAFVLTLVSIVQIVIGIREVFNRLKGAVALGYFYTIDGLPVAKHRKCFELEARHGAQTRKRFIRALYEAKGLEPEAPASHRGPVEL